GAWAKEPVSARPGRPGRGRTERMNTQERAAAASICVGIEVSKAALDVALRPSGAPWRSANDEAGVAELVARLQPLAPPLVVLEATGGLERLAVAALALAGLPVVVVHPRQVRDFAKATGQLAKTEALDAAVLAHFAQAIRPQPRPLPDEGGEPGARRPPRAPPPAGRDAEGAEEP